jgi:hypothetical protein
VVERAEAIEEGFDQLSNPTQAQFDALRDELSADVRAMARELCERPVRELRLWTRATMAALVDANRQAAALREAMAAANWNARTLASAADVACSHVCALLGCHEARVYVARPQHPAAGPSSSKQPAPEVLHRLCSTDAGYAEVAASDTIVYGARAQGVPFASIAGECLTSTAIGAVMRASSASPSFNAVADCTPGSAPPSSILYMNVSDSSGPLRAVLRASTLQEGARDGGPSARQEGILRELAPLISLMLREAMRHSPDHAPAPARGAKGLATFLTALKEIPRVVHDQGGDLAALMRELGGILAESVCADGCVLFLYNREEDLLVGYPPLDGGRSHGETIDVPLADIHIKAANVGLAGRCATDTDVFIVPERACYDSRFNVDVDGTTESDPELVHSLLCVPFRTVDERRLLGVCQVINKRDARFDTFDSNTIELLLRCVAFLVTNWQMRELL